MKITDVRNPSFRIKKERNKEIQAAEDLLDHLDDFIDEIEDPVSLASPSTEETEEWKFEISEIVDEAENLKDFIEDKLGKMKGGRK